MSRTADPATYAARERARAWHAALRAWETTRLRALHPQRGGLQPRAASCPACLYEPADWLHERLLQGPPGSALLARTGLSRRALEHHRLHCMERGEEQRYALAVRTPLGDLPEAAVGAALSSLERPDPFSDTARMVRRLRAGTCTATIIRTNPHRWAAPVPVSRAYGLLCLRVGAALGDDLAKESLSVLEPSR